MELLAILIISFGMIPIAVLTSGPVRIILGFILILFFPGYTLMAAISPKKDSLSGIERTALSFGLSIIVVPLIGIFLNYTPWGINTYPILGSIILFIIITTFWALYRRRRLPEHDRFDPYLSLQTKTSGIPSPGRDLTNITLIIALVLTIMSTIGSLSYVMFAHKTVGFTEFYLLDLNKKADNYPINTRVGIQNQVYVIIMNREHETVEYRVKIRINDEEISEPLMVTLNHDEKWEYKAGFTFRSEGLKQKVEFLLYKGDSTNIIEALHLFVNVRG